MTPTNPMPVTLTKRVNCLSLQEAQSWLTGLIEARGGYHNVRISFSRCCPSLLPYESSASAEGICMAVFWSGEEFIKSGIASERCGILDGWAQENLRAFMLMAFQEESPMPIYSALPFVGMTGAIESFEVVFEALGEDNFWHPMARLRAAEYKAYESKYTEGAWYATPTRYECTVPGWVDI